MTNDAAVRELILSVGTHRAARPLSPLEVANGIVTLTNEVGWDAALRRISLGESTARRFLKLRELHPEVAELVGWGREPGAIAFSVASEICRLTAEDQQRQLASACLEHRLTKEEARQVVQIRIRSTRELAGIIDEVVGMRPQTQVIHAVLGAVRSPSVRDSLGLMHQSERDRLFDHVLADLLGGAAAGRLAPHSFSIVFQGKQEDSLIADLEDRVNSWLEGPPPGVGNNG